MEQASLVHSKEKCFLSACPRKSFMKKKTKNAARRTIEIQQQIRVNVSTQLVTVSTRYQAIEPSKFQTYDLILSGRKGRIRKCSQLRRVAFLKVLLNLWEQTNSLELFDSITKVFNPCQCIDLILDMYILILTQMCRSDYILDPFIAYYLLQIKILNID